MLQAQEVARPEAELARLLEALMLLVEVRVEDLVQEEEVARLTEQRQLLARQEAELARLLEARAVLRQAALMTEEMFLQVSWEQLVEPSADQKLELAVEVLLQPKELAVQEEEPMQGGSEEVGLAWVVREALMVHLEHAGAMARLLERKVADRLEEKMALMETLVLGKAASVMKVLGEHQVLMEHPLRR